jgi:hypothetical protein
VGDIQPAQPVKLICGIIAAGEEFLRRAQGELRAAFGDTDVSSDVTAFDFTDYYEAEMGMGLLRQFVSFRDFGDPGSLAAIKRRTNEIERRLAVPVAGGWRRRVNLDPGYVAPSQLVLASTKNFAHRIYLGEGIYAEVTLLFRKGGPEYLPWTYPDFRSGRYDEFLREVRRRLLAPPTS